MLGRGLTSGKAGLLTNCIGGRASSGALRDGSEIPGVRLDTSNSPCHSGDGPPAGSVGSEGPAGSEEPISARPMVPLNVQPRALASCMIGDSAKNTQGYSGHTRAATRFTKDMMMYGIQIR